MPHISLFFRYKDPVIAFFMTAVVMGKKRSKTARNELQLILSNITKYKSGELTKLTHDIDGWIGYEENLRHLIRIYRAAISFMDDHDALLSLDDPLSNQEFRDALGKKINTYIEDTYDVLKVLLAEEAQLLAEGKELSEDKAKLVAHPTTTPISEFRSVAKWPVYLFSGRVILSQIINACCKRDPVRTYSMCVGLTPSRLFEDYSKAPGSSRLGTYIPAYEEMMHMTYVHIRHREICNVLGKEDITFEDMIEYDNMDVERTVSMYPRRHAFCIADTVYCLSCKEHTGSATFCKEHSRDVPVERQLKQCSKIKSISTGKKKVEVQCEMPVRDLDSEFCKNHSRNIERDPAYTILSRRDLGFVHYPGKVEIDHAGSAIGGSDMHLRF